MKKAGFLIICFLFMLPAFGRTGNPPGFKIILTSSFLVPSKFVNNFFNCAEPDSARFYLSKSLPDTSEVKDTFSLLFKLIMKSKNSRVTWTFDDYRFLINGLVETGYGDFFRLYNKGATKEIFTYSDYKPDGTKQKELTLIDPGLRLLELTTFFKGGTVMTRTQLQDSSRKMPFEWYSDYYPLIKVGKKITYYSNGNTRSVYQYKSNHLQDTSTVFYSSGEMMYQEIWNKDSLVNKLVNKNISKQNQGSGVADNRKKAFLVGIDLYQFDFDNTRPVVDSTAIQWGTNLDGCVNDVSILREALERSRNFQAQNIVLVTNENATREKLLGSFARFISTLKRGDIVFLHFSSKGQVVPVKTNEKVTGKEFAIVCRDADMARFEKGHNGFLYKSELDSIFNRIKKAIGNHGQMILSFDCGNIAAGTMQGVNPAANIPDEKAFRGETNNLLFNFFKKDDASGLYP